MKYYMHTLKGKPARYQKGGQICYAIGGASVTLVDSLRKIRKQEKASDKFRKDNNFPLDHDDYGYVTVKL